MRNQRNKTFRQTYIQKETHHIHKLILNIYTHTCKEKKTCTKMNALLKKKT